MVETAGVPAATVAEWAGQSVAVLLEVYASFLGGGEEVAKRQIERALGTPPRCARTRIAHRRRDSAVVRRGQPDKTRIGPYRVLAGRGRFCVIKEGALGGFEPATPASGGMG
jgi:hypothetical protein